MKTTTQDTPSERVIKLKERFLQSPYSVDTERARYYTRVWKRIENAGPCMKAATALSETLANMTIRIEDYELIVGVKSNKRRGGVIATEKGTFNGMAEVMTDPYADKRIKTVVGGTTGIRAEQLAESLSDEEKQEWRQDILPFWIGRTASNRKRELIEEAGIFKGTPSLGPTSLYKIFKGLGGFKGISSLLSKNKTEDKGELKIPGKPPIKQGLLKKLGGAIDGISKARDVLQDALPDLMYISLNLQGHTIPGYKRVLAIGFKGIADWSEKAFSDLVEGDDDYEQKKDFYGSVSIAARAVCDYAIRYAELAEKMAAQIADATRKAELLEIAEGCRRVPAEPPRTFMEAVQSIWMTQVALQISYGMDCVFSPGRVDQYLYPFYKSDMEAGRITRNKAFEAIEELLIKAADNYIAGDNVFTIGGLGRDGEDSTNDVSHLFLEALENIRGLGNSMPVRISPKTPKDFLIRACKVHRVTGGIAFYNDEIVIRNLLEDGFSLEDARDYGVIGCVEPTSGGNCFSYTAGNGIFLLGALEMALNKGRRVLGGNELIGIETPDTSTFKTFDEVKDAFSSQLAYIVDRTIQAAELKDRAYAESFPCLLLSSTIEGCLESGKDVTRGGAKYNHGHVNAQALASVANSLAAIKWAVFDEKLVTMKELVGHLHNNFKNAENLRQRLIHKAPKYGNDNPEVDEMAAWVAEILTRETRKHKSWRGGIYRPSLFSSGTQHIEGAFLGATPDGRQAADVVSNGISPSNGTELNGPTAVFNSAAKAGKAFLSDGTALNLNISPFMLKSDESVEKFASLIEGYFKMGGRQVQFNPFDAETLKDAQAHPEKYPDLTVKVTGYSAIFVDIAKPLQDDIIARTEFCKW